MELKKFGLTHAGDRGDVTTMYCGPSRARDKDGNVCDFTTIVKMRGKTATFHKHSSGLENAIKCHLELVEKMKNGEKIG